MSCFRARETRIRPRLLDARLTRQPQTLSSRELAGGTGLTPGLLFCLCEVSIVPTQALPTRTAAVQLRKKLRVTVYYRIEVRRCPKERVRMASPCLALLVVRYLEKDLRTI